ncbi:TRAP transporter large permease [Aquicoccus porphyridii]|uniref:TRAP transporter large permease protein n=1 Tax=Aquicoccus porphyridii TaxID=1852029 RepID=A0A5A9Z6U4_9RHOB|nr:TRAP transporter large permease subunit [Aquicoccus porphyridii]KAA0912878.1 TRAP transporter large permease subunit [Aquicoccus porphyridii]RAI54381.1 C4-dicarboxylate ABC transporter [Rhodobacteraceae bacterium AsT-22]
METLIEFLPAIMFLSLIAGLFTSLPVPIVLSAITLVFALIALWLGEMRPVHLSLIPTRIFGGVIDNAVLVAAPMFIFMGVVMEKTRIAEDLLLTLQKLMARVPGGLALAVVLMGTILAAATGIIGASVVMLTVMALPTMMRAGYSAPLATGTVASAGTLGILIPPSVMLVFMSDLLSLNLAKVFVAAFLPGLFLAGVYLVYLVLRSLLRPGETPVTARLEAGERAGLWRETIISVSFPLILIVSVLGSIIGGIASPTEASGVGAFAALLLGLIRGRLSLSTLGEATDSALRTIALLFFIFAAATAFSYVFRRIGGDEFIIEMARSLDLGDWALLFMMMAMVFVMGFFFDWIEITLILLPIFAPIVGLMDLGAHIDKADLVYWFTILVAVNLQTSFLTPPFGFALFYMKGAAGDLVEMRDIYRGIIPFVLLQVAVLAVLIWQPEIVMWLPNQVLSR